MITQMKKYAFLVFHREYMDFLEQLGALGVLHVIEREVSEEEAKVEYGMDDKEARLGRIQDALDLLKSAEKEFDEPARVHPKAAEADEMVREVEVVEETIDSLNHEIEELRKERERYAPWGNFDPEVIRAIEKSGYNAWLMKCTTRQYDPAWEMRDDIYTISKDGGNVYLLLVIKADQEPEMEAEYLRPPDRSLEALTGELEAKIKEKDGLREKLAGLARTVPKLLEGTIQELENELSLFRVIHETRKESEDTLMILEGWVPEKAEEEVAKLADEVHAVSIAAQPGEGEMPPVELRNGRFSKLFEPISKLFDLPAYGEMDLTPYFAPFFMLFFGFCLGDAGYGVFFILFATTPESQG
jgi:V/A-type H+-transporting ATPase subunit I